MNILYISISGNTRAFAHHLEKYGITQHTADPNEPLVQLKEIGENSLLEEETEPYFVLVPTYLEGGNGIDNGDQEILTEAMADYIAFANNATFCRGIVGSGNKNFNHQYCLTAKQYAAKFNTPFLADYELRGTPRDVERIYRILADIARQSFPN